MNKEEFLEVYRHSMAHILAKAVIELYGKEVQYAIGPQIEDGCYYDFVLPKAVTQDDFKTIEDKMREAEYKLATADAENSQSLLRTYEQLTSRFEALGGYDYEPRMKAALAGLGLTDIDFTRDISSFSGGEKMRICLARLIVSRPDILLLDEPTNHLDTDALEWLEGFIRSYGGAVLLISHDRYFIDKTVTKVLELENSTITAYRGNYTDYK